MMLRAGQRKTIKWIARVMALGILCFGLPFYFGYGNPLPFINPEYSWWTNIWLSIFPLMFLGLALGWKYPRLGGYITALPVGAGLVMAVLVEHEMIWHMLVPLVAGVLFVITGQKESEA
jgi:hypothetical protein